MLALSNVPKDNVFRTNLGLEIQNLEQLSDVMKGMPEHSFRHHVNENKNDFAAWIIDVIKDEELGLRLLQTKDRAETAKIIETRVKELKSMYSDPLHKVIMNDLHPIQHLKKHIHSWLMGVLLGLVLGFIIGIIVGSY